MTYENQQSRTLYKKHLKTILTNSIRINVKKLEINVLKNAAS